MGWIWVQNYIIFDLLSIMELACVCLIFELGWFSIVLESAEVIFAELGLGVGLETLVERWLLTFIVLSVDCRACRFGERLAEEVLRLNLGYISSVAWDMLSLKVLSWAA